MRKKEVPGTFAVASLHMRANLAVVITEYAFKSHRSRLTAWSNIAGPDQTAGSSLIRINTAGNSSALLDCSTLWYSLYFRFSSDYINW